MRGCGHQYLCRDLRGPDLWRVGQQPALWRSERRPDGGTDGEYLVGDDGDDSIFGGSGNDQIFGGSGADRILGGAGRDTMSGGTGGDVFVFETLTDMGNGGLRDVISDFQVGVDDVGLQGLGLTFISAGPFTGANQVRWIQANPLLAVETTGDGVVDFSLTLQSVVGFTASDILL